MEDNNKRMASLILKCFVGVLICAIVIVGIRAVADMDFGFSISKDPDGNIIIGTDKDTDPLTDTSDSPSDTPTDTSEQPSDTTAPEDTDGGATNGLQVLQLKDYRFQLGVQDNGEYWLALHMDGALKPSTHYTVSWGFDSEAMKTYGAYFVYRDDSGGVTRPTLLYIDCQTDAHNAPDLTITGVSDSRFYSGTENFNTGSDPSTAFFYVLAFRAENQEAAVALAKEIKDNCIIHFTVEQRW